MDAAMNLCRTCEVQGACLAWALEAGDCHGIWGATTPRERRAMLVAWRTESDDVVSASTRVIDITSLRLMVSASHVGSSDFDSLSAEALDRGVRVGEFSAISTIDLLDACGPVGAGAG